MPRMLRTLLLAAGATARGDDAAPLRTDALGEQDLSLEHMEAAFIRRALDVTRGNKGRAARALVAARSRAQAPARAPPEHRRAPGARPPAVVEPLDLRDSHGATLAARGGSELARAVSAREYRDRSRTFGLPRGRTDAGAVAMISPRVRRLQTALARGGELFSDEPNPIMRGCERLESVGDV